MTDGRRLRGIGSRTLALGVGLLLCLGAVSAATATPPVNVNVSHQDGNQQETTVAVNPNNSRQVFIASNDESLAQGLFTGRSSDGGATWTHRSIATNSDGLPAACCDPSASWDTFGNLFLTYLTLIDAGDG